jgi:hypothetical protein
MAIRTLNPGDAYARQDFVNAMEDLTNLGGISQTASTADGNWNPDLRKGLGKLLQNNQTFYSGVEPDSVINDAQTSYSQYEGEMVDYVITNFSTLLGKSTKDQGLMALATSLPLKETGNRSMDKTIKVINEKKKIAKIMQEGGIEGYVMDKMRNAEPWRQEAFFGYSVGNQGYMEKTFQAYAQSAEMDFRNALFVDGNLNKGKIRNIVKENYNMIVADKGANSKEAKAFQMAVAQTAYAAVK